MKSPSGAQLTVVTSNDGPGYKDGDGDSGGGGLTEREFVEEYFFNRALTCVGPMSALETIREGRAAWAALSEIPA